MQNFGAGVKEKIADSGVSFSWPQASSDSGQLPSTPPSSSKTSVPESIDQMKDKVFQASKLGFKQDTHVSEKKADEVTIWKIKSIVADAATLVQMADGEEGCQKDVPFETLLHNWRVHKGKVTESLPGWNFDTKPCSPLDSKSWEMDAAKGAVALVMRDAYQKHAGLIQHLQILVNPTTLKTTKAFKVGELKLVGVSSRIDRKASTGSVNLGKVGDSELHAAPHFVAPLDNKGEANKNAWVAPFWLVPAADRDANMVKKSFVGCVNGFSVRVPILQNSVPLKPGDKLCVLKTIEVANDGAKGGKRGRTYPDDVEATDCVKGGKRSRKGDNKGA